MQRLRRQRTAGECLRASCLKRALELPVADCDAALCTAVWLIWLQTRCRLLCLRFHQG